MKTLKTIQADLFNVFVEGNANKQQQARVFILLFVPLYTLYAIVGDLK
ncbi:hypothetical protein [Mucilaginibacter limnophilus]|nr:hypothetical protein [Mucilaginibacter limnophilus]